MDWTEFSNVFGTVGPTVIALAVVILNGRDRLADKVSELSERVARIEGILVKRQTWRRRRRPSRTARRQGWSS